MSRAPTAEPRRRANACPVCGKPPSAERTPFCSQGCRDRDLLNWLGDSYRVPGPPAGLDSEP
ncbi:MAG TPA: DNA gyrase inhibitor YacG [Allosphingosinicella sp.]|nr:DNA gyrase inhibitor YacG [Allosphingosinicella sp.]